MMCWSLLQGIAEVQKEVGESRNMKQPGRLRFVDFLITIATWSVIAENNGRIFLSEHHYQFEQMVKDVRFLIQNKKKCAKNPTLKTSGTSSIADGRHHIVSPIGAKNSLFRKGLKKCS